LLIQQNKDILAKMWWNGKKVLRKTWKYYEKTWRKRANCTKKSLQKCDLLKKM
jgi:hypothetical protein